MIAVPSRVKVTLDLLIRAAEAGAPCPSNNDIAFVLEAESPSAGTNAVALLESMGVIKVHRNNSSRVVEIIATGARTAGTINKPHWRAREKATAKPARPRARSKAARYDRWTNNDDALLMERIAEGDDFEQAGMMVGKSGDVCSARFDYLASQLGVQAI